MSEEDFIRFLRENGRTPETTRCISITVSFSQTKTWLENKGHFLSDAEIEAVSSIRRQDLAESIRILEDGGAFFDKTTGTYMMRKDFL